MTEVKKPTRQYKKRAEKSSEIAEELFPSDIKPVPVSDRPEASLKEYDVDDIYADFNGSTDNRTGKGSIGTARSTKDLYAKTPNASINHEETSYSTESANPGSPKVEGDTLDEFLRAEELAADLARKHRFIEGVDDAKIGVPFKGAEAEIDSPQMPLSYGDQPSMRATGVVFNEFGILDTGEGAQGKEDIPQKREIDDPASPNFMVCVNKNCRYREQCLRYRLSNKRDIKGVFYPEDCRRDGIFMDVNSSKFEAYDPMSILESTSTPSF